MIKQFLLAAVLAAAAAATTAHAEKRVALVIGNSAYQNLEPLPHPMKDSEALTDMFLRAGFDVVVTKRNLRTVEFRRALREFGRFAEEADVAVLYFSGHGVDLNDVSYVFPVDTLLPLGAHDVQDEGLPLDRLFLAVKPAKRLRVMILDAARASFFAGQRVKEAQTPVPATKITKSFPDESNFVFVSAPTRYSEGESTGNGQSPFTGALLAHLIEPGVGIREALRRVRRNVIKSTGNREEPFIYSTFDGEDIPLVPPLSQAGNPTSVGKR